MLNSSKWTKIITFFKNKRMSKQFYLNIIAIVFSFTLFGQGESELILNATTHIDHVEKGAKGILVNYQLNIDLIKQNYPNDSLQAIALESLKLSFILTPWIAERQVKPGYGFQNLKDKNGFFELNRTHFPTYEEIAKGIMSCEIFIPYSSLQLTSEKQQITWKIDVSTKDGKNIRYSQQIEKITKYFTPPATHYFNVNLDSLIVNFFDTKGQAWDRSMFGSDAPDLDFTIYIGGISVGNIHKGNSYSIVFSDKPRIFKFAISENDEVYISFLDTDNLFHDEIASWKFDTANMKKGVEYKQTEKKANLKDFSFSCKVD